MKKMHKSRFIDLVNLFVRKEDAKRNVVIIGDSMIDEYHSCFSLNKCQEGSHFKIGECSQDDYPGGAANIASIMYELGSKVTLVTLCGASFTNLRALLDKEIIIIDLSMCFPDIKTDFLTVKKRYRFNRETLLRIDDDHVIDQNFDNVWNNKYIDVLMQSILKDADVVIVQDYGKGMINSNLNKILRMWVDRNKTDIIYGPHKNSSVDTKIDCDFIKLNFEEYKKLMGLEDNDKYSYYQSTTLDMMKKLTKKFNAKKGALLTNPGGLEMFLSERSSSQGMKVCGGTLFVNRPNVAGAGDIVMAMFGQLPRSYWEVSDSLEMEKTISFIGKTASLKCTYDKNRPYMRELFEDIYERFVDHNTHILGIPPDRVLRAMKYIMKSFIIINGCFDKLHPGHMKLFEKANDLNEKGEFAVLVGINNDKSYRRLKKKNPTFKLADRIDQIRMIRGVDYVFDYETETDLEYVCSIMKPAFMVKGDDYSNKKITGESHCGDVVFVPRYGHYSSRKL